MKKYIYVDEINKMVNEIDQKSVNNFLNVNGDEVIIAETETTIFLADCESNLAEKTYFEDNKKRLEILEKFLESMI